MATLYNNSKSLRKITAKDVDTTVKARKQPMGKGPKGGRMPYESDGESAAKKSKSKKK
jgi:hypothetical protein